MGGALPPRGGLRPPSTPRIIVSRTRLVVVLARHDGHEGDEGCEGDEVSALNGAMAGMPGPRPSG